MTGTSGVIYVLKEKIGGRDRWERIANTKAEFMKMGGEVIEQPTVEEYPASRRSMLELINGVPGNDRMIRSSLFQPGKK